VDVRSRALEDMVTVRPAAWKGRSVLVTGHTGFKGGWLSFWLAQMGARVTGYALAPSDGPSFFAVTNLGSVVRDRRGDVRDVEATRAAVHAAAPDVVFHLAAQPLVRESYRTPVETYATNVVGTASVLDGCRTCDAVRAIVVITSDKCYDNREWDRGYLETDALGGHDPYSNSKACAELVCDAFRRSYFSTGTPAIGLATARAGNVIGGGDWSQDRLLPDLVRAAAQDSETMIRNPLATRPWQHVLDPLHGYLLLAERLIEAPSAVAEAWNFGPSNGGNLSVGEVVSRASRYWPGRLRWRADVGAHPHEAGRLMLDSTKAHQRLGWRQRLSLDEALRLSLDWYAHSLAGNIDMQAVTSRQIEYYLSLA
jgi:CDP-glucose 4,6-dehydratase